MPGTIREIPELAGAGRLGRHVFHDPRSLPYRYPLRAVPVTSVTWARQIPVLDQGDLGSCTGNALVGALGTDPLFGALPEGHPVLDEALAVREYSEAEQVDGGAGYPPEDQGSSGLSVCKAAKKDGLLSGYTHCLGLDDVLAALQAGPVLLGTNWYSTMDDVGADGTVNVTAGAYVRGGHEYVARQADAELEMIGCDNSWGPGWGAAGSFRMSWDLLDRLLHEDGDATVPVLTTMPPPQPAPPLTDPDEIFAAVARPWSERNHPANLTMWRATQRWLAAKGL